MRPCITHLLLCLALTTPALASTLAVTGSGTFSASTPATTFSAPGDTFSYDFDLSSTPAVSQVSAGDYFNAAFSDFTYTLSGVTTTPAVGSITFFSLSEAGLFDICFTTACNGGITPDFGFEFEGDQAYSGTEASPTILTGSYLPSDGGFYTSGNFYELASYTPIAIAPAPVVITPEPTSLALFGIGLLAAFRLSRRQQKKLALRP